MLEDTVLCAGRKVVTGLAGNRHKAGSRWVFVLAVTAASAVEIPVVVLDELDDVADFHGARDWLVSLERSIARCALEDA